MKRPTSMEVHALHRKHEPTRREDWAGMAARSAGCVQPAEAPCFLWDVQGTYCLLVRFHQHHMGRAEAQLTCHYASQPLLAVRRPSASAIPEGSAAGLSVRGHLTCKGQ